jgi:hypothetical protein
MKELVELYVNRIGYAANKYRIEQLLRDFAKEVQSQSTPLPEVLPTKEDACKECDKGESLYDEPEETQDKLLSRTEYAKSAYANGFLNCYDWLIKLQSLQPEQKKE